MSCDTRTVLVTDGDERPALAITRSLGRRGFRVLVGAERPVSLASASRYCAQRVVYPSPWRTPDAFARFVRDVVVRERIDVVVPVTDVTTHEVARCRGALELHSGVPAAHAAVECNTEWKAASAVPPLDAFELVTNKATLLQHASRCGIPIPRTQLVDDLAGLAAIAGRVQYPAVVKPARSRIRSAAGWTSTTVRYAHSEADLWHLYRTTEYLAAYPSLIQERIVGPGMGIFVLCDRGRVRTAFAHRRLREKPPSGGTSVLCESVAADPGLLAQAARLLQPLGWHGVAMLEYKQDLRSGRTVLMEVNGRFWGSLQLAVDAGVDFPYLCCQLALGQRLDVPASYKVGIRSRWLLGDLDHLLLRLWHGDRDLPGGTPSRLQTLANFLTPTGPRLRHEIFRRNDVRPALHELRQYAKGLRPFCRMQAAQP
jgi:predicted ATP-grasp superfamily ATP-dependent carboligase